MASALHEQIARKVAGLTRDGRTAVYEELRAGLQSEIRAAAPFMPVKVAIERRRDLETVIAMVEREAARFERPAPNAPRPPKASPAPSTVEAPPKMESPAPQTPADLQRKRAAHVQPSISLPPDSASDKTTEAVTPASRERLEEEPGEETAPPERSSSDDEEHTNGGQASDMYAKAILAAIAEALDKPERAESPSHDPESVPEAPLPSPSDVAPDSAPVRTIPPPAKDPAPLLSAAGTAPSAVPQARLDALESQSNFADERTQSPEASGPELEDSPIEDLQLEPRRLSLAVYAGVAAMAVCVVALVAVLIGGELGKLSSTLPEAVAIPQKAAPAKPSPISRVVDDSEFRQAAVAALEDGKSLIRRGEFGRAIASLDDAIRLDAALAEAFAVRAFAHWNAGDVRGAISDYSAALERDPADPALRLNRAVAYNRAGEYQQAVADLDRVLAAEPDNVEARSSRCWTRAILKYLQEALEDCNRALELRPDDANTLDSRAVVFLRLGRLDRAIADFTVVLKEQPRNAGALYGRGLARIGRGDRGGGNEDVAAARAIDPEIVEIFARYGIR